MNKGKKFSAHQPLRWLGGPMRAFLMPGGGYRLGIPAISTPGHANRCVFLYVHLLFNHWLLCMDVSRSLVSLRSPGPQIHERTIHTQQPRLQAWSPIRGICWDFVLRTCYANQIDHPDRDDNRELLKYMIQLSKPLPLPRAFHSLLISS
jgi:hypothetical protein